jgi:hypothetical protein
VTIKDTASKVGVYTMANLDLPTATAPSDLIAQIIAALTAILQSVLGGCIPPTPPAVHAMFLNPTSWQQWACWRTTRRYVRNSMYWDAAYFAILKTGTELSVQETSDLIGEAKAMTLPEIQS